MNPGGDSVTFNARGPVVSRDGNGIATYAVTSTVVTGCFLQPMSVKDKVSDTEFASATHRCISPGRPAVIACMAEDTLTFNDVSYRVVGKKVYNDWNGRLDHITVVVEEVVV